MRKTITLLALLNIAVFAQTPITDPRDGKKYKTVKIGKQVWMVQNLNYSSELYDWESAMLSCPDGWHLPDNEAWQALINTAGESTAGRKLKSRNGWEKWDCEWTTIDDRGRTTKTSKCNSDNYGFAALPTSTNGNSGFWWTASENYSGAAAIIMLHNSETAQQGNYRKTQQFNVRCLKGEKKLPASLAAKHRAMEEAARIAAQKEAEKKACIATGKNWFNDKCKTDEELAEAKCVSEGNVWVHSECRTKAEIAEENCLAAKNNWVHGECKTDEELAEATCVADGKIWINRDCKTYEEECVASGKIWTNDGCKTYEEVCVAGGKIWTNGECGYTVLVPSRVQSGAITQQVDRQVYQIDLAQPGTLSISVTTDGSSAALPSGGADVRWLNANNANVGSSLRVSVPYNESKYLSAGRYYIEVIGVDGIGNTGKFNIRADYFTDEIGNNSTIHSAQLLVPGLTVKGSITAQKNTGVYKYVLTKGGRLSVNVTGGTMSNGAVNLHWLDVNGKAIKHSSYGIYFPHKEYMDLEAGTYYFSLIKYHSNTGTYNLRVDFAAAENNEIESNETSATAQLLLPGQTVKGFISHQDNNDMYRIDLTQAGRLSVNVTGGTFSNGAVNLHWLDANGKAIKHSSYGIYFPHKEYMDLEAGTYYFSLIKYHSNTGTYSLRLDFTATENNEIEPNEMRATAQLLLPGQTVKGFISHQDNNDMYRIELTQAGRLNVNVTGGTLSSGSINLHWHDTDGKVIKHSTYGIYFPHKEYMDLEAGTYYISVIKYHSSTGTYNLTVQY